MHTLMLSCQPTLHRCTFIGTRLINNNWSLWLLEFLTLFVFQLAIYMNRSFWEKKQEEAARPSPTPSAPAPVIDSGTDAQITAIKVAEVRNALFGSSVSFAVHPIFDSFDHFVYPLDSSHCQCSATRTESPKRTMNNSCKRYVMRWPPSVTACAATTLVGAASPMTQPCSPSSRQLGTCNHSCCNSSMLLTRRDVCAACFTLHACFHHSLRSPLCQPHLLINNKKFSPFHFCELP